MSKRSELNWSADLRRIAWWLQTGNISLAEKFIKRGKKLYSKGRRVGNQDWSWWMAEISRKDKDHLKEAERALTWSILLR